MKLQKIENQNKIELANCQNIGIFCKEFNAVMIFKKYHKVNTVKKAINDDYIKLSQIKKKFGKESVEAYLAVLILDLNESLNIIRKLTNNQIREIAAYIYDDYYFLNLAELNLFFSRIKKGFYGQLYEGIDIVKIMGFFAQYNKERSDYLNSRNGQINIENSISMQERINFIMTGLEGSQIFKKFIHK